MIPAYIIAKDRLSMIRNTVEQCQRLDLVPVIVDNASTYPPLLEWYNTYPCSKVFLSEQYQQSYPHRNVWKHILTNVHDFIEKWNTEYYVVTDPDLELSTLPDDTIEVLKRGLISGCVHKCGPSLDISNVHQDWHEKVIEWEQQFWERPVELFSDSQIYYEAPIDTTFALYNIYNASEQKYWDCSAKALRVGAPYMVHHIPWERGKGDWSEEDQYYFDHMNKSISWTYSKKENYNGATDVKEVL